jgi:hypothetical protein
MKLAIKAILKRHVIIFFIFLAGSVLGLIDIRNDHLPRGKVKSNTNADFGVNLLERKSKSLRKMHNKFLSLNKMKRDWAPDILVGIESELKIFPKEYDSNDILNNCDHLYLSYTPRACIKDDSDILLKFDNKKMYRMLGWDAVNARETGGKVYEFRTLDGLNKANLLQYFEEFVMWVQPIYDSFTKAKLEDHTDRGNYKTFDFKGTKMVLTNNYSYEPNGLPVFTINNQVTFSCKMDNISKVVSKIIEENENKDKQFMNVNYSERKPLTIFTKNGWNNENISDNWYNSSFKKIISKISQEMVSTLNERQKVLLYYILSAFQDGDPSQQSNRKVFIKGSGNNFLKPMFKFFPKIAEHVYLKEGDISHDIFKIKELLDLELPYKLRKINGSFLTVKVENYLNVLDKYITFLNSPDGSDKFKFPTNLSFIDCIIQENKHEVCLDFDEKIVCARATLFPGTFIEEKERMVMEIRAFKNSMLPHGDEIDTKATLKEKYENLFLNFFDSLNFSY